MGCARLQKPLPGPAPLVEAGHRTGAYVLPLAIPREANTGALRTFFSRDRTGRRGLARNRVLRSQARKR